MLNGTQYARQKQLVVRSTQGQNRAVRSTQGGGVTLKQRTQINYNLLTYVKEVKIDELMVLSALLHLTYNEQQWIIKTHVFFNIM